MLGTGRHDSPGEKQAQHGKEADRNNHRMNNSPVLFIFEKKSHYQKNRSHRPGQKIACVKNRIDKQDAQRQATAYLKKGM